MEPIKTATLLAGFAQNKITLDFFLCVQFDFIVNKDQKRHSNYPETNHNRETTLQFTFNLYQGVKVPHFFEKMQQEIEDVVWEMFLKTQHNKIL